MIFFPLEFHKNEADWNILQLARCCQGYNPATLPVRQLLELKDVSVKESEIASDLNIYLQW